MRTRLAALLLAFGLLVPVTAVAVSLPDAKPASASWIDTGTAAQGCYWYAYRDNNRTGYFYFESTFAHFWVSCQFPYRIQCQRPNGSTYWKGKFYATAYGNHERFPSPQVWRSVKCGPAGTIIRADVLANQVYSF